jgi:hypothetical protein
LRPGDQIWVGFVHFDAYKIAFKSLARRYLELHDEIADLDVMISGIVDELAPELIAGKAIGYESAAQLLIPLETIQND